MSPSGGLVPDDGAEQDGRARLHQWRRNHPDATLREIEQEVDRQPGPWRAPLVTQVAHQTPAPTRPLRPRCGEPMHRVGQREWTVRTAQDQRLTLRGPGCRCPAGGAGLFPPG